MTRRRRSKLNIVIECCAYSTFVNEEMVGLNSEKTVTQATSDPSVLTEFKRDSFSTFCLV